MKAAIDTVYRGHRFRSRLEARWAVLMDHAGIEWRYEPDGYQITMLDGSTRWYLPDFYLPASKVWLEVKGDVTLDVIRLMAACAVPGMGLPNVKDDPSRAGPRVMLVGEIPDEGREPEGVLFSFLKGSVFAGWAWLDELADTEFRFMERDVIVAEDDGTLYVEYARELAWDFELRPGWPARRFGAAANAARQARFEHEHSHRGRAASRHNALTITR